MLTQQDRFFYVDSEHVIMRTKLWIHREADSVIEQLNNHNLKNNEQIGAAAALMGLNVCRPL